MIIENDWIKGEYNPDISLEEDETLFSTFAKLRGLAISQLNKKESKNVINSLWKAENNIIHLLEKIQEQNND